MLPIRTTLPRRRLVPLIVACPLFMENLDSSMMSNALPAIAASLGESPLHLSLAITSYLLALVVMLPLSGYLADRLGARRVFACAIAGFVLGSLVCAEAGSLTGFTLGRMVQGGSSALMVPIGRLVLLRSVTKAELVGALAFLTVPAMVGPVIGPLIGGFLTTYVTWRWIFLLNLPIGLLGIALVLLFIEEQREANLPRLDLGGYLLVALGLTATVGGVETIGRAVVPPALTICLLLAGVLGLGMYVFHARRLAAPVLDLSLLRLATFRASVGGGFFFRIGVGAIPFLLPLMLQLGFGLSAMQSGSLTFVAAIGAMFMKVVAKPVLQLFGFRTALVVNGVMSSAMIAALGALAPDTPEAAVLAVLFVGGFLRSLQFTAINAIGYAEVPAARMSRATSLSSVAQQLALSLGVGVGALVLTLTVGLRGHGQPVAADFAIAFYVIGAISMLSALVFARLPADAGAEMAGRAVPPPATPRPAAAD